MTEKPARGTISKGRYLARAFSCLKSNTPNSHHEKRMWSTASTTAIYTTWAADIGFLLATIIAGILAAVAGLLIIGMAVRKTKKHVTGKKF